MEIIELPLLECFEQEVKTELEDKNLKQSEEATCKMESEIDCDLDCDNESGSDWNEVNGSTDTSSHYKSSSYKKRKSDKSKAINTKRKRYVKRSQSQKLQDNEPIELAGLEDSQRNLDDGTLSLSALAQYPNRWQNMKLICFECDRVVNGPLELKNHYNLEHSPSNGGFEKYKCADCDGSEVVEAFHKFLNHVTEIHQPCLKFCCIACSEMFWSIDHLHQHHQTNHAEVPVFRCLLCGR